MEKPKEKRSRKTEIQRGRRRDRHTPDYCGIGAHQHQGKIEEKRSKLQKVKPPTPTRAIDALIGEKQKGKGREATGSFGRLLRPTLIIQWTYSEPCQHGDIYIINVCVYGCSD